MVNHAYGARLWFMHLCNTSLLQSTYYLSYYYATLNKWANLSFHFIFMSNLIMCSDFCCCLFSPLSNFSITMLRPKLVYWLMNKQAWFCRRQPLINICIICWYIRILILVPTASFWRSIMKREWKLSGVCRIQSRSKSNSIYYHYVFTNQNDDNPIQFMLVFHKGDRQLGIPSWGMIGNMEILACMTPLFHNV